MKMELFVRVQVQVKVQDKIDFEEWRIDPLLF